MSRLPFSMSAHVLDGSTATTVASILALDTAGRLDGELAAITRYLNDPHRTLRREVISSTLVRSIENAVAIARLLRQYVLDAMYRTEDALDVTECGVRARANILMRALQLFKQREHEVPAAALVAPFLRLHDLSIFLTNRVAQIYARWTEQTGTEQGLDRSTQRYLAVDEAEIAFVRLGRNAAFATFLRVGIACGSDAVRAACREIAGVVGLVPADWDIEPNQLAGSECTS
ncbi:MAG: hypothetical protein KIT31_05330 [Deltaproteobacteria bacterium]|nr:hypothetical protein [Deltaproteobacteria bacterium]